MSSHSNTPLLEPLASAPVPTFPGKNPPNVNGQPSQKTAGLLPGSDPTAMLTLNSRWPGPDAHQLAQGEEGVQDRRRSSSSSERRGRTRPAHCHTILEYLVDRQLLAQIVRVQPGKPRPAARASTALVLRRAARQAEQGREVSAGGGDAVRGHGHEGPLRVRRARNVRVVG
eukprot:763682-Hanusia_phi.AAC.1